MPANARVGRWWLLGLQDGRYSALWKRALHGDRRGFEKSGEEAIEATGSQGKGAQLSISQVVAIVGVDVGVGIGVGIGVGVDVSMSKPVLQS